MKYIDVEKLVAKLKKMQFTLNAAYRKPQSFYIVRAISLEYDDIFSLLDSLQQEQPTNTGNLCSELTDFLVRNDVPEEKAKFLANRISDEYGSKKYLEGLCDGIKQEQPDVDLKEEKKEWVNLMVGASFPEQDGGFISEEDYRSVIRQTARHFYELGLRQAAKMYDEIEYNKQKTKKSK